MPEERRLPAGHSPNHSVSGPNPNLGQDRSADPTSLYAGSVPDCSMTSRRLSSLLSTGVDPVSYRSAERPNGGETRFLDLRSSIARSQLLNSLKLSAPSQFHSSSKTPPVQGCGRWASNRYVITDLRDTTRQEGRRNAAGSHSLKSPNGTQTHRLHACPPENK